MRAKNVYLNIPTRVYILSLSLYIYVNIHKAPKYAVLVQSLLGLAIIPLDKHVYICIPTYVYILSLFIYMCMYICMYIHLIFHVCAFMCIYTEPLNMQFWYRRYWASLSFRSYLRSVMSLWSICLRRWHCNTRNTPQHIATHCNTLQHIATRCCTLLHSAALCYELLEKVTL